MYKVGLERKQNSLKRHLLPRIFTITGAAAAIAILIYSGAFKSIIQSNKEAAGSILANTAAADEAAPNRATGYGTADSGAEITAAGEEETGTADTQKKSADAQIEAAPEEPAAPVPSAESQSGARSFGFTATSAPAANVFDPAAAKVGDVVAGFEITDIEVSDRDASKDVRVVFDGETTLSGTLYFDDDENARWGKFIYFYVDDESAGLLPYPLNDDRQVWFGIDNYDDAVKMLDVQPEDEGKTIAYRAVIVINSYTVIQGSEEGCNYASLKSIETISRLSE
jgi:hypothetical protein